MTACEKASGRQSLHLCLAADTLLEGEGFWFLFLRCNLVELQITAGVN